MTLGCGRKLLSNPVWPMIFSGVYLMRAHISLPVVFTAFFLAGCAQVTNQISSTDAAAVYAKCVADVRATPESQLVSARLWVGDGTDWVAKLSDAKPLSPPEREALVQVHDRSAQCRQIVSQDKRYAAWQSPPWQEYFQRGDAIFYKLSNGELTVGLANKLAIESRGKFQAEVLKERADAIRPEEVQQQRAAEAMLQTSTQMAASQPRQGRQRVTTANCAWFGNSLNCNAVH
jgi:hypothetical protein